MRLLTISFFKYLIKKLNRKFNHINKTIKIKKKWYGNSYGGFYVCPDSITNKSVVYSIGIGEDISFDLDLIKKHDCNVFGFDPTPKSIKWINNFPNCPSNFFFFKYGIADRSGVIDFYLPKNTEYVSGSFVAQNNINKLNKIKVNMKSFQDITNALGHSKIDILKMDIEGAEYNVLDNILESSIPIGQILIEFHERFFENGKDKTIEAIKKLKENGFEIFGISDSFEEISFIQKKTLTSKKN